MIFFCEENRCFIQYYFSHKSLFYGNSFDIKYICNSSCRNIAIKKPLNFGVKESYLKILNLKA